METTTQKFTNFARANRVLREKQTQGYNADYIMKGGNLVVGWSAGYLDRKAMRKALKEQ